MKRTVVLRDLVDLHQVLVRTSVSEQYEEERVVALIKRRGGKLEVSLPRVTGMYKPEVFDTLDAAVECALRHVDE